MQSDNLDKTKETIRKLLALGNDTGAIGGEIENSLRHARRLMMRHNLTEADIEAPRDPHEVAADTEYAQRETTTTGNAGLSSWEAWLVQAICDLLGTVGYYYSSQEVTAKTLHGTVKFDERGMPKVGRKLVFYGPVDDTREAFMLHEEWSHIMAATARLKYGGVFRGEGKHYAEGFGYGLYLSVQRLVAEDKKLIAAPLPEDAAARKNALVVRQEMSVVQAKLATAKDWLKKDQGITLAKGGSRRSNSWGTDAFAKGASDGKGAGFSRSRTLKIGRD